MTPYRLKELHSNWFEKILRPVEVRHGFLHFNSSQMQVLGNQFTLSYSGRAYSMHFNAANRTACKALLDAMNARAGMKLRFTKKESGETTLRVVGTPSTVG